jgi:simple sugar transport system permease protein
MAGMSKDAMSFVPKRWLESRWVILLLASFGLLAVWWLLNLVIGGKCDGQCVVSTLAQTLRKMTPIAFAALCGVMCERVGVTDIGIEGKMLMSAMVAYAVNLFVFQALKDVMPVESAANTSRLLALLVGTLAALPLAALHAGLAINIKIDQVISGTVINILAIGVTGYFYRQFLSENLPAGPGTFPIFNIPGLESVPVLGVLYQIFLQQKPLTYIMLITAVVVNYVLFFTPWGLRTRAVGEHPRAADTLGVNVYRMRWINVLVGGLIAGLGGAWFTLEAVDVFNPMMTNGVGFIGLAAMIFGKWSPLGALVGAFIFGLGDSVTTILSYSRPDIPSQLPQMLPYILTIIVLTGVVGRAVPPAADGQPYNK